MTIKKILSDKITDKIIYMKYFKIIIALIFMMCSAWAFHVQAAERENKPILPKAGDIGIGIDLVPVLDYVGNIFNGTANNSWNTFGGEPVFSVGVPSPSLSIHGRYMITDNFVARLNAGILGGTLKEQFYVRDDADFFDNPLSEAKIVDTYQQSRSGMVLSMGAEYRRGYHRIQGYAGLNLIYGFVAMKDVYTYGNAITEINQMPSRNSAAFTVSPVPIATPYWTQTYVTGRYYDGDTQYVGLEGVIGVEYYISSHLSLGGEVSLYALQQFNKKAYQKQEGFNPLTNQLEYRTELLSPKGKMFSYGTDNLGGKLYMMFYF